MKTEIANTRLCIIANTNIIHCGHTNSLILIIDSAPLWTKWIQVMGKLAWFTVTEQVMSQVKFQKKDRS